jgi:hypothetical protein
LDTPSPELGSKAAVCAKILSVGIVSNALPGSTRFSFDSGFNAITEPDFCPVFYATLPFVFTLQKNKTGWIIGLKNKWFLDGKGCKKDPP